MAPELRKRKVASGSQKSQGPTTKAPEKASKVKRKAADDASPMSSKKQKATKPTSTRGKAADKLSKADKVDKAETPPKAEKPANADKAEKPSKADKEGKPSKADKEGKLFKADKTKKLTKTAVAEEKGAEGVSAETAPDSEGQEDDGPGQDVGEIPAISEDVLKAARPSTGERGVIYIGRIPHGFYEHEMRQYLSQFGPVSRVRLSRNRKTGASKHFAFVEFQNESTAEIVTKTMDNYLLFGHILKVKMVPKSQVHEELFKGANRRFKKVPWNKMAGQKLVKPRTHSAWEAKVEKERANRAQRADKLKAIGYEFEAPDLKDVPAAVPAEDAETKAAPAGDGDGDGDEAKGAPAQDVEEEAPEAEAKTSHAPKTQAHKKGTKPGKARKAKA
ncbi:RNA recognition motif domain-containing protein [Hirsutella rhossiliensis]|uniref:RNA recognition motif domain-containing protein n=1 Tax=Hirsutella rhossiliensis TaxID=111463 RepID=A0A9P8N7M2_9HYPO|nr:RNA recognition motif domain-containing protein [Hirsutella rhossiliensis]KAH0968244.1 RNA recognition motif domain-containing protein [Hirsutella rhossiliensis]